MKRFWLSSGSCLLVLGLLLQAPALAQSDEPPQPEAIPEAAEGEDGLPPEPPAEPAPSDADLAPVLRAWLPHEVRAVRTAINHTLQTLGERTLAHPKKKK